MQVAIEHNVNHAGEKPYNQCIACPDIGVVCDGPNFFAMTHDRLSEWSRLRKEFLHRQDAKWTNAYIADVAQVSKVTVDRFMAGTGGDLRLSTIQSVLKVLVNGSWGQYPCANPIANRGPEEQAREVLRLQGIIEDLRREHRSNMDISREEAEKKVAYLKDLVNKHEARIDRQDEEIKNGLRRFIVSVCVSGVMALVIIAALVVDMLNPNIGFFWLG